MTARSEAQIAVNIEVYTLYFPLSSSFSFFSFFSLSVCNNMTACLAGAYLNLCIPMYCYYPSGPIIAAYVGDAAKLALQA